jgi:hypothetical protein
MSKITAKAISNRHSPSGESRRFEKGIEESNVLV